MLALRFLLVLTAFVTPVSPVYAIDTATIVSVYDGDTLRVAVGGKLEIVRLIGVDSPEVTVLRERAEKFAATILPAGAVVRLEHDRAERDKYGRLLAYVFLPSGEMFNEKILMLGYAKPVSMPPNQRYDGRFRDAARSAKTARRGFWSMPGH